MNKRVKSITTMVTLALIGLIVLVFVICIIFKDMIDGGLIASYITLGISVFVALIFPIIHMASNPKGAIKGFLGFAAIVVLGLISYLLSSNELTALQLERLKVSDTISVLVGSGLILTYIVGVATVIAAIFLAIRGSISK
jgi:hypothetical protein